MLRLSPMTDEMLRLTDGRAAEADGMTTAAIGNGLKTDGQQLLLRRGDGEGK